MKTLNLAPLFALLAVGCTALVGLDGVYIEGAADGGSTEADGDGGGRLGPSDPGKEPGVDGSPGADVEPGDATADGGEAGTSGIASCKSNGAICGPLGTDDCCKSALVPGGTFNRVNRPTGQATLSPYRLDVYEVTNARLRAFVQAGYGTQANPPAPGAGAHPNVPASGWKATYNASLPQNKAALLTELQCANGSGTFSEQPGPNDRRPAACLSWYVAFAFCAWDGARLPSEAEASFAATGGSEQRDYPWWAPGAAQVIDATYANYDGTATKPVGALSPKGDGKWGHADLSGNVAEWTLDAFRDPFRLPCTDCVETEDTTLRVRLGGGFSEGPGTAKNDFHYANAPSYTRGYVGVRCARTP